MPRVRRTRTLGARPEAVWRVVGDPHHLPRWWPRVTRVERAGDGHFTQVLMTKKGRPIRADFRLAELEEPQLVAWEQELPGTPFEHVLSSARTEVALTPAGAGTEVAIVQVHKLRGWAHFSPFLFSAATRKLLDEALDGLERISG